PARVAVAEVGSVSPPTAVLTQMRGQPAVFADALPIPSVANGLTIAAPRPPSTHAASGAGAPSAAVRMRGYARELGADYLFLYGGTIEQATNNTPLSLANLTIIGAFVVPATRIDAAERASGSLVDVSSGRVLLTVSADASRRA